MCKFRFIGVYITPRRYFVGSTIFSEYLYICKLLNSHKWKILNRIVYVCIYEHAHVCTTPMYIYVLYVKISFLYISAYAYMCKGDFLNISIFVHGNSYMCTRAWTSVCEVRPLDTYIVLSFYTGMAHYMDRWLILVFLCMIQYLIFCMYLF